MNEVNLREIVGFLSFDDSGFSRFMKSCVKKNLKIAKRRGIKKINRTGDERKVIIE